MIGLELKAPIYKIYLGLKMYRNKEVRSTKRHVIPVIAKCITSLT